MAVPAGKSTKNSRIFNSIRYYVVYSPAEERSAGLFLSQREKNAENGKYSLRRAEKFKLSVNSSFPTESSLLFAGI